MSDSQLTGLLLLIVIVLMLGLIPAVAVSTQNQESNTYEQNLHQEIKIQDSFYANITSIQSSGDATFNLFYNDTTFDSHSQTVNISETKTFTVNSEDIDVTNLQELKNNQELFVRYSHSSYLGWPDAAILIIENAHILLIAVTILLITAFVYSMMESDKNGF